MAYTVHASAVAIAVQTRASTRTRENVLLSIFLTPRSRSHSRPLTVAASCTSRWGFAGATWICGGVSLSLRKSVHFTERNYYSTRSLSLFLVLRIHFCLLSLLYTDIERRIRAWYAMALTAFAGLPAVRSVLCGIAFPMSSGFGLLTLRSLPLSHPRFSCRAEHARRRATAVRPRCRRRRCSGCQPAWGPCAAQT